MSCIIQTTDDYFYKTLLESSTLEFIEKLPKILIPRNEYQAIELMKINGNFLPFVDYKYITKNVIDEALSTSGESVGRFFKPIWSFMTPRLRKIHIKAKPIDIIQYYRRVSNREYISLIIEAAKNEPLINDKCKWSNYIHNDIFCPYLPFIGKIEIGMEQIKKFGKTIIKHPTKKDIEDFYYRDNDFDIPSNAVFKTKTDYVHQMFKLYPDVDFSFHFYCVSAAYLSRLVFKDKAIFHRLPINYQFIPQFARYYYGLEMSESDIKKDIFKKNLEKRTKDMSWYNFRSIYGIPLQHPYRIELQEKFSRESLKLTDYPTELLTLDICREFIEKNSRNFYYIPQVFETDLLSDIEFCLNVIKHDSESFIKIRDFHPDLFERAYTLNRGIILYKEDVTLEELIKAIEEYPSLIIKVLEIAFNCEVDNIYIQNLQVLIKTALQQDGLLLKYIPRQFITLELICVAIREDTSIMEWINSVSLFRIPDFDKFTWISQEGKRLIDEPYYPELVKLHSEIIDSIKKDDDTEEEEDF